MADVEPYVRPAYSSVHPHSLFLYYLLEYYLTIFTYFEELERWAMDGEVGSY
jgi:hypothetical protein